mgnify:CR=1 FL=1
MKCFLMCGVLFFVCSVAVAGVFEFGAKLGFTPGPLASQRMAQKHEKSMMQMQMSHERSMNRYGRAPVRYSVPKGYYKATAPKYYFYTPRH